MAKRKTIGDVSIAFMSIIFPLGVIYLIDTIFPKVFPFWHDDNVWDYFLVGFYLLGGYWYLRMDKKDESRIPKSSWIAYFIVGLILITLNVGMYFQENKSFLYIVFFTIVLTALVLVFSIRYQRNKKRSNCS